MDSAFASALDEVACHVVTSFSLVRQMRYIFNHMNEWAKRRTVLALLTASWSLPPLADFLDNEFAPHISLDQSVVADQIP